MERMKVKPAEQHNEEREFPKKTGRPARVSTAPILENPLQTARYAKLARLGYAL
jgi:hypothetical protein